MKKYKHLLFDLDRTLYDFDNNNRKTLLDVFEKYGLKEKGVPSFDDFFEVYKPINFQLWQQYKKKEITKEKLNLSPFSKTLEVFGLNHGLEKDISIDYVSLSPLQTKLLPDTHEVLAYLQKRYKLHIITNGFEEVQYLKIKRCSLEKYFTHIITSESAGAQKPALKIFDYALEKIRAVPGECLIIGDDPESDIRGGLQAGIDQVWIAQAGETTPVKPTFQIKQLKELMDFL